MSELAAYVGWDWADRKHQVCIREPESRRVENYELPGTAEAIHEWAMKMLIRYEGRPVGICIETSRGAVIGALMNYPHLVFYPVNPKSAKSFREAFHPSGKKDDPVDADTLCLMVAQHESELKPLAPADPQTRLIGLLNEHRRKLVGEMVRATNRLRDSLKIYFPQALGLVGRLDTPMACDFLERWPTLEAAQRARRATIERFYRDHNSRTSSKIEQRLESIHHGVSLTTDPALMAAGAIQVRTLIRLVRSLIDAIKDVETELAEAYAQHPEHELIDSFPGAGDVMGPRLVAILGSDRDRFESREQLQLLTGVAPVTSRSGTIITVHRRIKRPKFLHQTIVEWAGHARKKSPWANAYYQSLRDAGKGHWVALRALGFKLLRILYRCWKEKTNYDESIHQESLRRHGSPYAVAA